MSNLERKTATDLAFSLTRNPKAWSWHNGDFGMVDGPGGITMSATYMAIYSPVKVRFGFWNRQRIRRAFKAWKRGTGNDLAARERDQALTILRRCLTELRAVA